MKTRKTDQHWKLPKKISVCFLFLLCLFYVAYLYLALSPTIYGINMDKFAANRNTTSEVLEAQRGTIYDANNSVLATNVSSYTMIAYLDSKRTTDKKNPQHVVDKEKTAKALAPIINTSESDILKILNKKAYQVELGSGARDITELTKKKIEELQLPGIDFIQKYKRYYPNGDFASYIIGYAKTKETTVKNGSKTTVNYSIDGELGIESKYNKTLKGTNGYLEYQRDRYGYRIPDTKETRIEAINGKNIYLTIDSNIQRFVETAVQTINDKYTPEWSQITIMDAKTGAILGSSQTPSYNPNKRDLVNYENALVSKAFEPGSTMKTYTYMCAMENGTYDGNKTFNSGNITIEDATIKDWNKYGWGTITYDKGFEYSSNVGISNMLQTFIGRKQLHDCFEKYGFGSLTGIDLDKEATGSVNFRYPVEIANAGFGQGITTTAAQHLKALSMLANNGKEITPYVVSKIIDSKTKQTTYKAKIKKTSQIISEATVEKMKNLMYNVVNSDDPNVTGKSYKIDGYNIIGKTGTAQIGNEKTGGYLTGWNDYVYSFAGMFPKDNPEIIIYAAVKKPKIAASYTVSEAVVELIKNIAKYKNMFTETETKASLETFKMPSYINKSASDTQLVLNSKKINTILLGDGNKIINQYPNKGTRIVSYDTVFLLTNSKNIKMPDLTGYTRSEAESVLELLNLKYEIEGYGHVESQSISTGSAINKNDKIKITLKKDDVS